MTDNTLSKKRWDKLSSLQPSELCTRAGISFDNKSRTYTITSFGQDFLISPDKFEITCHTPEGNSLLAIRDYFFDLSLLWYMVNAQDISLSGTLVKPSTLPGGQIFLQGTHVLPLNEIATKFNDSGEQFLEVAKKYGAVAGEHGDVSIRLLPFPRVPVHLILWFGDDDFPPSGQLLLDSTCPSHLSTDVLWAVTMVCCLIFLKN